MSNGIARPTSIQPPARALPEQAQPAAPVPMQGQPGPQDMEALLALLMMLMQSGGMGQGAPQMPMPQGDYGPPR